MKHGRDVGEVPSTSRPITLATAHIYLWRSGAPRRDQHLRIAPPPPQKKGCAYTELIPPARHLRRQNLRSELDNGVSNRDLLMQK